MQLYRITHSCARGLMRTTLNIVFAGRLFAAVQTPRPTTRSESCFYVESYLQIRANRRISASCDTDRRRLGRIRSLARDNKRQLRIIGESSGTFAPTAITPQIAPDMCTFRIRVMRVRCIANALVAPALVGSLLMPRRAR